MDFAAAIPIAKPRTPQKFDFARAFVAAWVCGSTAIVAIACVRMQRFRRMVKEAQPAGEWFEREIDEVAQNSEFAARSARGSCR